MHVFEDTKSREPIREYGFRSFHLLYAENTKKIHVGPPYTENYGRRGIFIRHLKIDCQQEIPNAKNQKRGIPK